MAGSSWSFYRRNVDEVDVDEEFLGLIFFLVVKYFPLAVLKC
jgi:hypothetical protein